MKVNLVLSGGGARGLAHLGLIKVLNECGIHINAISGVSAGAMVGALIAQGFSPEEVLQIFIDAKLLHHIRPGFDGGLFRITKWEGILIKYIPHNSFGQLKIPLTIHATDINECIKVEFTSGPLVMPVLASCAVPGIFSPVTIDNRQYIDGGVIDNLPLTPFENESEPIIASHVNPIAYENKITSSLIIMERSMHLAIRDNLSEKIKKVSLFVEPPALAKFSLFGFEFATDIFEAGYDYASQFRNKLEDLHKQHNII